MTQAALPGTIIGLDGKPVASRQIPKPCPQCGASEQFQQPSSGFGDPHLVCIKCGYERTK